MKKLTLNEAWRLCLKQWKWIIRQLAKGDKRSIGSLKRQWCQENGFNDVVANCFFCAYARQNGDGCDHCPGKLVNRRFGCDRVTYEHDVYPHKFYAKLLELDKKRKSKKVK